MSELDKLTEIIVTILGNDNQARNQGELLLKKLRESDFNTYIITFANLLNGIFLSFQKPNSNSVSNQTSPYILRCPP
jgi:hypothetical protein